MNLLLEEMQNLHFTRSANKKSTNFENNLEIERDSEIYDIEYNNENAEVSNSNTESDSEYEISTSFVDLMFISKNK